VLGQPGAADHALSYLNCRRQFGYECIKPELACVGTVSQVSLTHGVKTGVLVVSQVCKRSLHTGEPHQVRAQTEARALARREANARGEEIEEREGHRRNDGAGEDLLHVELLLGDDKASKRHREALQEVLDSACNELRHCETVHTYNLGIENVSDTSFDLGLKTRS